MDGAWTRAALSGRGDDQRYVTDAALMFCGASVTRTLLHDATAVISGGMVRETATGGSTLPRSRVTRGVASAPTGTLSGLRPPPGAYGMPSAVLGTGDTVLHRGCRQNGMPGTGETVKVETGKGAGATLRGCRGRLSTACRQAGADARG